MTPPEGSANDAEESGGSEEREPEDRFTLELHQVDGFQFDVRFDLEGVEDLRVDEPEPVGEGRGPNPTRLVAAAVGNCLSASLLYCLQKSKIEGARLDATVTGALVRDERKRLRLGRLDVKIDLAGVPDEQRDRLDRCLGIFEDYCVVTQSIRDGVPVDVEVDVDASSGGGD